MNIPRESFVYGAAPQRVVFGSGTVRQLPAELERLGSQRALVLCTPYQNDLAEQIRQLSGGRACGVFDRAAMHTPIEVTEQALTVVQELQADCLVAVGGGSTTGLGKAIAARTGLTQLVVPTTYAGSEVTPILGETSAGLKTTRRGAEILPEVVLYDVELTLGLPRELSSCSGMNAIAHAVEALYARDANPIIRMMAQESIRALASALPCIVRDPADLDARYDALYGAWLGGTCLGSVEMAIHHKICHTLGGSFNLPHAETHAVMLPHSMAYVAAAVPEAMSRVLAATGAQGIDAPSAIHLLGRQIGVPQSLAAIGMPRDGLERAADLAVTNSYWNPAPLERDLILDHLRRAYDGLAPA